MEQSHFAEETPMKTEIFPQADQVAARAADYLEQEIREKLSHQKSFSLAISGGRTPWEMLKLLSRADLPWQQINLFQVDERVAPDGHPDRNLTQLFQAIAGTAMVTQLRIFPMPVTAEDLEVAAKEYTEVLNEVTDGKGLDMIHLGLGSDGHTASLVPGDGVLAIQDRLVACTQNNYQGKIRMTLTYPLLNSAKQILWIVTGSEKKEMVKRMLKQDPSIPAGSIRQENALLLVDQAAIEG
jgi:6-phosphogluconolactonase